MFNPPRLLLEYSCACGHIGEGLIWRILDLSENPEVFEHSEGIRSITCSRCGRETRVHDDLLVVNAFDSGILLFCPEALDSPLMPSAAARIAELLETPTPAPPESFIVTSRDVVTHLIDYATPNARQSIQSIAALVGDENLTAELLRVSEDRSHGEAFRASLSSQSFDELAGFFESYSAATASQYLKYLSRFVACMAPLEDSLDMVFIDGNIKISEKISRGESAALAVEIFATDVANYQEHVVWPRLMKLLEVLNSGEALQYSDRLDAYETAILYSEQLGNAQGTMQLHYQRARERLITETPFVHREDAAAAYSDLVEARNIAGDEGLEAARMSITVDLAGLIQKMPFGDTSENIERSLELFEEALAYFDQNREAEVSALIRTNMVTCYLARSEGGREANVAEAERLCALALETRNPDLSEVDYAYSIYQLAYTLATKAESAEIGSSESAITEESLGLYRESLSIFKRHDILVHVADAHRNIANLLLGHVHRVTRRRKVQHLRHLLPHEILDGLQGNKRADFLLEQAEVAGMNPGLFRDGTPEWASLLNASTRHDSSELALLQEAAHEASQAAELSAAGPGRASIHRIQGDILMERGDSDEQAIRVWLLGLSDLIELQEPDLEASICFALGSSLSSLGHWEDAAKYLTRAMRCVDALYTSGKSARSKSESVQMYPKLVEWASYALTRVGRFQEAVEALENGRAKQLGHRVMRDEPDMDRLWTFDPLLAGRLDKAQHRVPADTGDGQSYSLDDTLLRIRGLPGFERFGLEMSAEEIADAAAACPLLYLVATPVGSAALLAQSAPDGQLVVSMINRSSVSSAQLVTILAKFDSTGDAEGLLGGRQKLVDEALDTTKALLGDMYGRALHSAASRVGLREVTLVPAGIIGSLPLGTASIGYADRSLTDSLAISVVPSAAVSIGCRRRALRRVREPSIFVGLGDPERDDPNARLAWAEAEVRRSASFYTDSTVRIGAAANVDFFKSRAPTATHLHLACHGYSDIARPENSAVKLADGIVSAADAAWTTAFDCRIAVLSACETGRYGLGGALNEVRGLATGLLEAGAACVVASLWKVDDLATSLMMAKFHEYLVTNTPAVALQKAQAWLRGLDAQSIVALGEITADRGLLAEFRSLRRGGSRRPFAHPRYWAPFVVMGH